MQSDFVVFGTNKKAPFTLKVHRGDGMALLAMDWKDGKPPRDFVGFGIESKEPRGRKFFAVNNRLNFDDPPSTSTTGRNSSLIAPIQYFRWVHFPRNAELKGAFTYRVTAVFMDDEDNLTYSEPQEVDIELARETYPGKLNVAFTRGYIASQAFVDYYCQNPSDMKTLLPAKAEHGLEFVPTHPKAAEALEWMGFEARREVLGVLDEAIEDPSAEVYAVVYDLNQPEVIERFEKLQGRLKIMIDDSGKHGLKTSPETKAAKRLAISAGPGNVRRGHVGGLQHNKTIAVTGKVNKAICGSANLTWRGLFVQNNHAVVVQGKKAVQHFADAFDDYWNNKDSAGGFGKTGSADWKDLGLAGIDASITFSPRSTKNAVLPGLAADIGASKSSLFYSLAFLHQTPGKVREALVKLQKANKVFSFGIADHEVGVLRLTNPSGLVRVVHPEVLGKTPPHPFKPEPVGGGGNRMHHKFVVADFDQPEARVYFGSYNFSSAADTSNGENLLLIRDRRIATSFMIEAVRIYDHYAYRVARAAAKGKGRPLRLKRPPGKGEKPWWDKFYSDPFRAKDRILFSRP